MLKSIRQKLIVTYFILLFLVIPPLTFILEQYVENLYLKTSYDNLEAQGKIIAGILSSDNFISDSTGKVIQQLKALNATADSRITVMDKRGFVLADTDEDYREMESHLNRPEVQAALRGKVGKENRLSDTLGKKMFYLALPIVKEKNVGQQEIIGVVRIAKPATAILKVQDQIIQIILLFSSIMFLMGILISVKMARNLTIPIEKINTVAKNISNGKFTERVRLDSIDELGQLSHTINRMAATIQNKIEESLETSKRLQLILNSLDSGVVVLDSLGKIRIANPATYRIFHKEKTEVLDKTLLELLRNTVLDDKFKETITERKSTESQFSLTYPFNKTINATFTPILESDEVLSVVGVFHDISSIKEVEKIRTQFVANASHELQTPLTAVKGFTEILLDGAMNDPNALEKFLKIIHKEANRLHKIIDGLLKLSLLESETHKFISVPLNMTNILTEVALTMKNKMVKASLAFEVEIPSKVINVLGDPDLLPQVFYNLLGNAIKYTPAEGKVVMGLFEETNHVKIIIEDTGIGIPEEDLSRIFERFYRVDKARSRAKGGTGLGLSIVKHIVDAHKGNIEVKSKLEQGTKFIITLPKG